MVCLLGACQVASEVSAQLPKGCCAVLDLIEHVLLGGNKESAARKLPSGIISLG